MSTFGFRGGQRAIKYTKRADCMLWRVIGVERNKLCSDSSSRLVVRPKASSRWAAGTAAGSRRYQHELDKERCRAIDIHLQAHIRTRLEHVAVGRCILKLSIGQFLTHRNAILSHSNETTCTSLR